MNNIKKGLIILSLASVCVVGFAATKSVAQSSAQPSAQQPSSAQQSAQQSAPSNTSQKPPAPAAPKK